MNDHRQGPGSAVRDADRQVNSLVSNAASELWDVAVIGAGMGGATLGHDLAVAGYRVVFLEKGHIHFPAAQHAIGAAGEEPLGRLENGLWPTKVTGVVGGAKSRFFAPLGCGSGGSSLIYAAALERFEPSDFSAVPGVMHPTGGWPISYQHLKPYYCLAEKLFRVRGTADPLRPENGSELPPPPPLSQRDEHFERRFRARGLHPYRLHVAYGFSPGCMECGGFICPRKCKGDAGTICLDPAVATGNAHVIDLCEVERLEADANSVQEIRCRRGEATFSIRARIVVLAAGALFTPVLLMNSANAHWPTGLANSSGMVGRNLMFHVSDLIAVWARGRHSATGPRNALALRDFYTFGDARLGSFQSTGLRAGYGSILEFLNSRFDRSRWSWLKPLRSMMRIPAFLAWKLFGDATIFATIMEDLPYSDNLVAVDKDEPSGMRFEYTVRKELRRRLQLFRTLYARALAGHRFFVLDTDVALNFGHPCGTCRFGEDPSTSVLDPNNRAHGLTNLYVADASFMPTSGGANPSLTIAANALRIAAHIRKVLPKTGAAHLTSAAPADAATRRT